MVARPDRRACDRSPADAAHRPRDHCRAGAECGSARCPRRCPAPLRPCPSSSPFTPPSSPAAKGDVMIARTGYTGEDGFEIVLPAADAEGLWSRLRAAGVVPCGLGARDTLRLEAGMNLYGQDMDETVSPLESGLAWTVDLESPRDFIGKSALLAHPAARQQVGLALDRQGRRAAGASDRAYRTRRRRNHERHVQPDAQSARSLSRACPWASRLGSTVKVRRARPGARGARREAAFRAQRRGARAPVPINEIRHARRHSRSLTDKSQEQS